MEVETTPTEVVASFQSLKRKKAIWKDRSSGDMLKDKFKLLQHYFLYKCFVSAACPTEWKTAIVTPIYKSKGSRGDLDNYRWISILPAMHKVYSKISRARLVQPSYAYPPEPQNDFCSGYSIITAISTLLKDVQTALDTPMSFSICFVDLRKAFNSVKRRIIFYQTANYGHFSSFF